MILQRFVAVIFFVAFTLVAKAQRVHFVYLQTENGQPFYVKLNNKVSSSSPLGYLILPKLADGDYKLTVGFPKKEFPEENFEILIDKKSEGYLLKNFGEKGWGLFNLQSLAVVMGGNVVTAVSTSKNLQDDPFSKMLANVVKDSTILQKNESVKEPMPVTVKADPGPVKLDSAITKVDSIIIAVAEQPVPLLLSPATRLLRKKNKDGMEMIYVDRDQNLNDTIRIFIPLQKSIVKTDNVDTGLVQNKKALTTSPGDTASITIDQPASQMKSDTTLFVSPEKENTLENKDTATTKEIEIIKQPQVDIPDSVITSEKKTEAIKKDDIVVLPKVVQSSTTNSDCRAFANDEDFLRLRKKMASENSPDNMIKMAKKSFHLKCFSTEQIKNLSFLFLKDEGKYQFFDTAYPFTSDSDQYHTLQSQLSDSYFISRFRAMIHK